MTISSRLLPLTALLLPLVSCEKQESPPPPATTPPARTLPAPSSAPGTPLPEPSPISGETASTAVETTPALENFKAEMTALKTFMDEQGQRQETAQGGMAALKEIIARARAVKTEGLPEDLSEAWEAMTIVMTKMERELESLPVPADQLEEYFADQVAKNPAGLAELQPKLEAFQQRMEQIGQEGKIASANLRDTAQKYGIEGIDLGN